MKVKWSKLIIKITAWLFAEIFLTLLNLDNLADYGEFVFQSKALIEIAEASTALILSA